MTKIMVFASVSVIAILLSSGCGQRNTVRSPEGRELALTKPANLVLRQGETAKLEVMITRRNFSDEVGLDFDGLPSGVSLAGEQNVASGESSRVLSIVAKDDAELVDRRMIKVEAKGGGIIVNQTFELTVRPK